MENYNQNNALLEQRIKNLEKEINDLQDEVKDLDSRVSNHDVSIAKIELIVEGLKTQWASLETTIRQAMEGNNEKHTTSAWKETTIEAIKAITYVSGAILAAKIFLG